MKTPILTSLRNSRWVKGLALFMASSMTLELCWPNQAFALTSGPAQEEFSSFEPVGTTDLVDLNTGDFTYNIPLLSVPGPNGGYPINLAYHSGIGMDQEASWVGLGWNVNVGAINRQLRGLPDDFKGDEIVQKMNTKPSWSATLNVPDLKEGATYREFFGFDASSGGSQASLQVYFNNYKGLGYRVSYSPKAFQNNPDAEFSGSLNLSYDSQGGVGITPSLNVNAMYNAEHKKLTHGSGMTLGLSASFNSRAGYTGSSFSSKAKFSHTGSFSYEGKDGVENTELFYGDGGASSSSLSFGANQPTPNVTMPMKTWSVPFTVAYGASDFFGDFNAKFPQRWSGYYTKSKVRNDGIIKSKGYGFLHTEEAQGDESMRDYSRQDISYTKKIPNLAPSTMNFDLYGMTGQGTGGMFRPYLSEVPVFWDRKMKNRSNSYESGLEYGSGGSSIHVGVDYVNESGVSSSGDWVSGGSDIVAATNDHLTPPEYEAAYYKVFGEQTATLIEHDHLTEWNGDEAVRAKLEKENSWLDRSYTTTDKITKKDNTDQTIDSDMAARVQRETRAKNIRTLTNDQAQQYGMSKHLKFFDPAQGASGEYVDKTFDAPGHHISEVEVIQPDGMRYFYGLPAYNHDQYDVTMSVDGGMLADHTTRTVPVQSDTYKNTDKKFLSRTELPDYAHSWLLTTVVSPDYVDLTQNGPSDDDLGYYTKFNYEKTHDRFQWRVPYWEGNFQEGNMGDNTDDAAFYSYGEKEIYFLKSIETKTHIAVFTTSFREDGLGAAGEYATETQKGTQKMKKLEQIDLYSKKEYYNTDGSENTSAVPIKTVHFAYDYSLCGGVNPDNTPVLPNNSGASVDVNGAPTSVPAENVNANMGKLTLKKVWFTYQKSTRGALSPYKFHYEDNDQNTNENPNYDPRNVDRWGNYKDNSQYSNELYPAVKFPYTDQADELNTGTYASSSDYVPEVAQWTLRKLELPSGATMEVEYESDDYAYVENQRAMRMFDIVGVGNDVVSDQFQNVGSIGYPFRDKLSPQPFELGEHVTGDQGNHRIYFELDHPIDPSLNAQQRADFIIENYVGKMRKLYFRTLINLKKYQHKRERDFVQGYADLVDPKLHNANNDYYGVVQANGSWSVGYITLEGVKINDKINISGKKIHPFQKAALQHLKMNRSNLIFDLVIPEANNPATNLAQVMSTVFGMPDELFGMIISYYLWSYIKGYSKNIYLDGNSVIRLYDGDLKKFGGGIRVKQLTITDNWVSNKDPQTGNLTYKNSRYGQKYDYTIEENGQTISSGVAYEPVIGVEEDALTQPVVYEESSYFTTSQSLYMENPILRTLYPGARVGYRQVTVSSIAPDEAPHSIENSAAPISVYQFYSSKEFPVVYDQTEITLEPAINRLIFVPGVYTSFRKRIGRSQGYSIIMNDMDGKLKSTAMYTRGGDPVNGPDQTLISKQEYIYQTENKYDPNGINKLDNRVQVMTKNGVYRPAILGQSHDVYFAMNENHERTKKRGVHGNLDILTSSPIPVPVPVPLPQLADREMSLKTIVTHKVIHRSGIIKKVITTDEKSVIEQESLAFDEMTGEALLTKVNNEYKDPIYNVSYPGRWFYHGLRGAFRNLGITFDQLSLNGSGQLSGFVLPAGKILAQYFTEGDELWVDGNVRAWVTFVGTNSITCIDENGALLSGTPGAAATVIRSGHRNQLTTKVGGVAFKELNDFYQNDMTPGPKALTKDKIIDASAVELGDEAKYDCSDCGFEGVSDPNPYRTGQKGIWRLRKSYAYNTERVYQDNIQEDGVYEEFAEFPWPPNTPNYGNWVLSNSVTLYSPYGYELENVDALGNPSAAIYGYGKSVPTAIAKNAKYREIGFDGFEDYDCETCNDMHFGYKVHKTFVTEDESHTGRKSIRVTSGSTISVEKDL